MKKLKRLTPGQLFVFLLMLCIVVVFLWPILWAVISSFKFNRDILDDGYGFWPSRWTLGNYEEMLSNNTNAPLMRWFLNSMLISGTHTILMILVSSMAAYGYQRLQFKGRDTLFITIMVLSMIPAVMNIIPQFAIVSAFGWVNSMWAVVVPGLGVVTNVFLIRQFLYGVPRAIDESALIDGCSQFGTYWRIVLPSCKPVLIVVALFSFTGSWNDLLWPSIVFSNVDNMPLTVGLQLLQNMYDQHYTGSVLAGAVIALVPTFLLFLFAQKNFIKTMSFAAAVKG